MQKVLEEGMCDSMRPRGKGGPRSDPTSPPHLAGVDSAHHVGAPPCGHMGQVGDIARQLLHDQLVNGAHNLHEVSMHN